MTITSPSKRFLFVVFPIIFSSLIENGFSATDKVVCYYTDWSVYRPGNGKFTPEDVDATICTHINYAFLGVNADGTLLIIDKWASIDLGAFAKLKALKTKNPNLKLIFSIGGWNAGNAILKSISASPQLRQNLATSSLDFFQTYGFDGLDIDWEYPLAADKENFVTLMTELKSAFQSKYLLTLAVSAIPIDDAYDYVAMNANVDIINLMTYDFHVYSQGVTGGNSPLHAGSSDNAWQKQNENVEVTVKNWVSRGVNSQKLTIGIPFYAHTFTLTDPAKHGVGAPANGPGPQGPYTKNAGTLGYNEVCELYKDYEKVWDDEQKLPYKFKGNQWMSYDDEQSIKLKVQFAKENNVGGLMIWSVDTDDFRGVCGPKRALLQSIKNNL